MTVKDVDEETRKDGNEVEVHVATFRRQSDRVGGLIGAYGMPNSGNTYIFKQIDELKV